MAGNESQAPASSEEMKPQSDDENPEPQPDVAKTGAKPGLPAGWIMNACLISPEGDEIKDEEQLQDIIKKKYPQVSLSEFGWVFECEGTTNISSTCLFCRRRLTARVPHSSLAACT